MENLPPFYRKYTVETHPTGRPMAKTLILAAIDKMVTEGGIQSDNGFEPIDFSFNDMGASDYPVKNIAYRDRQTYQPIVRRYVGPMLNHFASLWKQDEFQIGQMWFAQYEENNTFSWHTHEGCNMSAIYFVELPEPESATRFYGIDMGDMLLEEGDVFVFPAMIPHRSPVINKGKGRKTVIGINGNMHNSTLPNDYEGELNGKTEKT